MYSNTAHPLIFYVIGNIFSNNAFKCSVIPSQNIFINYLGYITDKP